MKKTNTIILTVISMMLAACELEFDRQSLSALDAIEFERDEPQNIRVAKQCIQMCDEAMVTGCMHDNCYGECMSIINQTPGCVALADMMFTCVEDYSPCEQDTYEEICEVPILYFNELCE